MRRYTELEVALELAKLVRIFEVVARNRPNLAGGLTAAVGYTKLWSQKFAPNENGHPYPDFDIKADQIASFAEDGKIPLQIHVAPIETPKKIRTTFQMNEREFEETLQVEKTKKIFHTIMNNGVQFTFGSIRKSNPNINGADLGNMLGRLCAAGIIRRISTGLYARNNGEENGAAE